MDLLNLNGTALYEVERINVVLGKNGCGKSFLLKRVESALLAREGIARVRYISPERGGLVVYEPSFEQSIDNDPNWLSNRRRRNQAADFRKESAALFRRSELAFLRAIEVDQNEHGYVPRTFDVVVSALNELLDRVRIVRSNKGAFDLEVRETGQPADPSDISSGESELVSLGIEFLAFFQEAKAGSENVLLVDEPDVHLHPDLQDRLSKFVVKAMADKPARVIFATHSTALLAGLCRNADVRVAFMRAGDQDLRFKPVTNVDHAILPIFGAHPLSNVFTESPILLVEGEDDERVWQQAVRSGQGRIRLYPCPVDGLPRLSEYERQVNDIIEAVYDDARGYSLRDRDVQPEEIADLNHVSRMRLSCRAAENLMLSDNVLALAATDWPTVQNQIQHWVEANPEHQYHRQVQAFLDSDFDRKGHDLKEIRNVLLGIFSNKPWEVLVGQAVAKLAQDGGPAPAGSLRDFLGAQVCSNLLGLPAL